MRIDEVTYENMYNEKSAKDPCLVFTRELYNSSLIINGITVMSPNIF